MTEKEINDSAIKRLKIYLGISPDDTYNDELFRLVLSDAANAVLGYCHVNALSPLLEAVAVQMAQRKIREDNGEALQSLKMGDVTLSYQAPISSGMFTETEKSALNSSRMIRAR